MNKNNLTYVAMDTHKKEHTVLVEYPTGDTVACSIKNTPAEIARMVKRIKSVAGDSEVIFCYEAGVCGFNLKRYIKSFGVACKVIAPSLIPQKPGEKIKTDRRDAKKLLTMLKADLLTEVHTPDEQQEALRELSRMRQGIKESLMRIRHQILKFLTRHGFIYPQGCHWTQKHQRWLRSIKFDNKLLQEIYEAYLIEMAHCLARQEELDKRIEQAAATEPYAEIIGLLRCFHGIDTISAFAIITEIFELGRFPSAGEFMSYLGLVPSERSSGSRQHKGRITKNGNKRVRRLLTETSWHYRHMFSVSKHLAERRKGQPQWAIDIADKAARRLRRRYEHLIHSGKNHNTTITAIARELAGFIWSMVHYYEIYKQSQTANVA